MTHTQPHAAVFKHVGDLATLRNLLKSSPNANTAFNEDPVDIFNHVAGQAPKALQQIIHAVAISNSPNVEDPLIENGILYNREGTFDPHTEAEDRLPPIDFDLPGAVLKQILELAYRIELLATLFLKTTLQRLYDLRPQHLAKPDFMFTSYPFRKFPPGQPYAPARTGPPSWVEEYRVNRALWRLQLFCLLSKPNARVTPKINEEAEYVECCIPHRQHEFTRILGHLTSWEIDEMIGIQDHLETSRISLRAPPSSAHDNDAASIITTSTGMSVNSVHAPQIDPMTSPTMRSALAHPFKKAKHAENQVSPFQKYDDIIAVKRSTEAYNFFHRYGLLHITSPLQRSQWANFRRLGFGIWDQERMCAMELFRLPAAIRERPGVKDLSIDNVAFTWTSVENAGQRRLSDVNGGADEVAEQMARLSTTSAEKRGGSTSTAAKKKKDEGKKRDEKPLKGLKGLMRSRNKGAVKLAKEDSDTSSSPRTSLEDLKYRGLKENGMPMGMT